MAPYGILRPTVEYLAFKILATICIFLAAVHLYAAVIPGVTIPQSASNSDGKRHNTSGTHKVFCYGHTKCLPDITQQLVDSAIDEQAVCWQHSPFPTNLEDVRIGVASAHFGSGYDEYQKALQTHLLHGMVHGSELHVMCDPMVDNLWNKPVFILNLLMEQMIRQTYERLDWIIWVDRDTMILDQCRPISTFLPPHFTQDSTRKGNSDDGNLRKIENTTNLIVNNDFNGLNNGVFILRVGSWAIELLNAIIAFRHYNPDVELKFTEQSAMEKVINLDKFRRNVVFVPQYWFNGYPQGGPDQFQGRTGKQKLGNEHVRRGDYLVHFAGNPNKREAINAWSDMLQMLPNVWKSETVQRDISDEVKRFWKEQ